MTSSLAEHPNQACPRSGSHKTRDLGRSSLEAVTPACVDICVVLELAEEGVRVVAEEYVGAEFPGEVVVNLVVDVRTHIDVLVRRRKVGEQRTGKILIPVQLCNPEREQMAIFFSCFAAGG